MEAFRADRPPRQRKSLRQLTPLRRTRGTEPAFEQLYKQHAREVYQYALALLTNPADAEDATQTAFMNAYRAYQRGERPHKPHNWLIAITHNVCRMRWRQAGSRPLEVALEEAPEPAALEHERANLDEVLTALAGLSFNQRSALVMRELEGRSYQEIAGVLGLSVGAVEALLFRARRRLKLHRSAIAVLTTVPLPGSLTSFLGGAGGGAVAAGSAAVGADLVLKAAAVVVAGAVAGVGYKSVQAVTAAPPTRAEATSQLAPPVQSRALAGLAHASRARARSHPKNLRRATAPTARNRFAPATSSVQSPTPPETLAPTSPVAAAPTETPVGAAGPLTRAVPPVTTTTVEVPSVQVPPVTVGPVQVTPPATPPLPVTAPTPTLPPLQPLPAPPPILPLK
ncbi:MAG TPA: sigma-70 family RNA polymerase sigma factor [Gaiellaceae bacterium]|nr:sigma-70 family RNA polymerase sigma factor [Gaiellaceae bacterium]